MKVGDLVKFTPTTWVGIVTGEDGSYFSVIWVGSEDGKATYHLPSCLELLNEYR
jgi:hypothetical protein